MANNIIQIDYEQMETIASRFNQQANVIVTLYQDLVVK